MKTIYRMEEIDFKTNLSINDVRYLTKLYIERQKYEYEIKETILYDTESVIVNGAKAWVVFLIPLEMKKTFLDEYLLLEIPDDDEWIVYLVDNVGFPYEKVNLLTGESVLLYESSWQRKGKSRKGKSRKGGLC